MQRFNISRRLRAKARALKQARLRKVIAKQPKASSQKGRRLLTKVKKSKVKHKQIGDPDFAKFSSVAEKMCMKPFPNLAKNDSSPHSDFIAEIADGLRSIEHMENYLELGVNHCLTFNVVAPYAKVAYAVDKHKHPEREIKASNAKWFFMTSQAFLNQTTEKFDLIFIDANHDASMVYKDIKGSMKVLTDIGIIVAHDTYPGNPWYADVQHCGSAYEAIWRIRKECPNYEVMTFPFYCGMTIIRKTSAKPLWMVLAMELRECEVQKKQESYN